MLLFRNARRLCTGCFRIIDFHSEFIARVHTHTLTKTESVVLNGKSKEKNYIGKKKWFFFFFYNILLYSLGPGD